MFEQVILARIQNDIRIEIIAKLSVSKFGAQIGASICDTDSFWLLERFGDKFELKKVSAHSPLQELPSDRDEQVDYVKSCPPVHLADLIQE
jgi:hypothetical protein